MSGTNRVISSENILKGEGILAKALENANEEAVKIEGKKEKNNK